MRAGMLLATSLLSSSRLSSIDVCYFFSQFYVIYDLQKEDYYYELRLRKKLSRSPYLKEVPSLGDKINDQPYNEKTAQSDQTLPSSSFTSFPTFMANISCRQ